MHVDIMTMFGEKGDFLGLRASDGKDRPVKLESRAVFLFGRTLVHVSTEHPSLSVFSNTNEVGNNC